MRESPEKMEMNVFANLNLRLKYNTYIIILTLCLLGKFACFFCRLLTFFQNPIFRTIISGIPPVSNSLDPDQAEILSGLTLVQTVCI